MRDYDDSGNDSGWTWSHGIIIFSGEWTWLAMLLLMAVPFALLLFFMEKAALFFARHVIIIGVVYLLASLALAAAIYLPKGKRWRVPGFAAVLLTTVPTFLALTFYLIPFEVLDPGFDAIFDFILIMLPFLGGAILIISISRHLNNGFTHLAIAAVYFVLCLLLLRVAVSTESDIISLESIKTLYGL